MGTEEWERFIFTEGKEGTEVDATLACLGLLLFQKIKTQTLIPLSIIPLSILKFKAISLYGFGDAVRSWNLFSLFSPSEFP